MARLLWLDDYRDPLAPEGWLAFSPIPLADLQVTWVRNYDEFCKSLVEDGLPDAVCFDHDLGEEKDGKDCANFLVDYCLDNHRPLPKFASQSANPTGRENIIKYLEQAEEFLSQYKD